MADQMPEGRERRTQKDRSESMQRRVLDATLRCIGERGYIGVSLQDIADAAGVSRGAITHHYSSKIELTSSAIQHFVQWRHEKVYSAFEGKGDLDLRARLDVLWGEFQEIFPITFELIVALRSDKELLALYKRSSKTRIEEIVTGYDDFFPELSGMKVPGVLIAVMAAFYRGAYIEMVSREPGYIDEMKRVFQDMLMKYLGLDDPPSGPAA
ncbi:TetR/AcrR family transcriptional regulator [Hyphomonas sp. NPDC076900]|uniref:TetR/AcrR family transcriptional regulator n=1 Tax=unclassified Hyphomonas TaxID=2630699 RepID=UPI003CFD6556